MWPVPKLMTPLSSSAASAMSAMTFASGCSALVSAGTRLFDRSDIGLRISPTVSSSMPKASTMPESLMALPPSLTMVVTSP